ncbi:hypothetical protein CERSUDRAFT_47209 [Gelatoporia subvermispora B]|uniref:Uncharacterized protein n=1 Tax=Ceriporiopsis subvermispora (strain B) TaxID=914234 RepID=M2QPG4_CERS8|nr:hypothetical protein CERSUDRAFT_47209 [Gelatoporia subvermispora B]
MSNLNVSLEPHLEEALRPLPALLPRPLASQLNEALAAAAPNDSSDTSDAKRLIPYNVVHSISRWAHTPSGASALEAHNPPLSPSQYTMVSLLAGTLTSPDRAFPAPPPVVSHESIRKRQLGDRQAITALLNALLSIGGSGVATWWAAERLQWQAEWRVLLALFVAVVVALSEAILYLIWTSYNRQPPEKIQVRSLRRANAGGNGSQESKAPQASILTSGEVLDNGSKQQTVRRRRTKQRKLGG